MALEKAVDKVITEQKRSGDSQVSVLLSISCIPTDRAYLPIVTNNLLLLYLVCQALIPGT